MKGTTGTLRRFNLPCTERLLFFFLFLKILTVRYRYLAFWEMPVKKYIGTEFLYTYFFKISFLALF